ncbi:Uncharacterised protein [Candidatus Bilamarchaeum dharawalense]|uniref:Uncharacterized protein n=1 Tax=Candidatus Bilamarchaeum dharawalense TaxID=2885759 RepID=A0A5E4LM98_9ARCH|nr:Uncharacterised protein [Candidatus Bilamarchaeum dharawalense]
MEARRLGSALLDALGLVHIPTSRRGFKNKSPLMTINLIKPVPKPPKRTDIRKLVPESTIDRVSMLAIASARRKALDDLAKSIPYAAISSLPFQERLTFAKRDEIIRAGMHDMSIHELRLLTSREAMSRHTEITVQTLLSAGFSLADVVQTLHVIPEILNKVPGEILSAVQEVAGGSPTSLGEALAQLKAKLTYVPTMLR